MNTVNPDNFNETMDGYVDYAIEHLRSTLKYKGIDEIEIADIIGTLRTGIHWAKDDMTMEDARKYERKVRA